jgi:hypothetical protein
MFENGIKPPVSRPHRKYRFKDMKIGQSFVIEVAQDDTEERIRLMRNALSAAYNYRPKKFQTKSVKEGIRVWRVQ